LQWLHSMNSGIVIPPALFFLLSIALAIHSLFCFQMNFRVDFFQSLWWMSLGFWCESIEHVDCFW
jgi:hypothetical protein